MTSDEQVIRGDDVRMKYGAAGLVLSSLSIVPMTCSIPSRYEMSILLLFCRSWAIVNDRKIVPQYSSPEFCW